MSSGNSENSLIFIHAFKKAQEVTGLTQRQVAIKMDIRVQSLNPYVKGKYDPGLKFMIKVASAFGYDIVDFLALGREDEN